MMFKGTAVYAYVFFSYVIHLLHTVDKQYLNDIYMFMAETEKLYTDICVLMYMMVYSLRTAGESHTSLNH